MPNRTTTIEGFRIHEATRPSDAHCRNIINHGPFSLLVDQHDDDGLIRLSVAITPNGQHHEWIDHACTDFEGDTAALAAIEAESDEPGCLSIRLPYARIELSMHRDGLHANIYEDWALGAINAVHASHADVANDFPGHDEPPLKASKPFQFNDY